MPSEAQFNTTAPSGSDSHWIVTGGVSPVLILSASAEIRSHASIFNDSGASLYLRFGGGGVNVLPDWIIRHEGRFWNAVSSSEARVSRRDLGHLGCCVGTSSDPIFGPSSDLR